MCFFSSYSDSTGCCVSIVLSFTLWHWYKNFSEECNKIDLALSFVAFVVYVLWYIWCWLICTMLFDIFCAIFQFRPKIFICWCLHKQLRSIALFVDCLMKRKNPSCYSIRLLPAVVFIKIRKLYRKIFSMSHHEYRSYIHNRSKQTMSQSSRG